MTPVSDTSDERAVTDRPSFTCARCGGTFDKGWTDEEAAAEANDLFPAAVNEHPLAVICDDCWKAMGFDA